MVKLVSRSPFQDVDLPRRVGTVTLSEPATAKMTWVHIGSTGAAAFKKCTGVNFPSPNRATGKDGGRAIWFGPQQALWVGPALANDPDLAETDQSDAWATLLLEGVDATEVLARLCPLDLRGSVFKRGHTARTMLGHMACSLTLVGKNRFDIKVFRSMAQTALDELTHASQQVAASRLAE